MSQIMRMGDGGLVGLDTVSSASIERIRALIEVKVSHLFLMITFGSY